jgi:Na+-translocating ferredoxin:NAD+ oxidoreductase RnfE subunit
MVVGAVRQGAAYGLPLAALPPGAFLTVALLLAAKNAVAARA